ncbi:MAG: hypothetical protein ACRBCI_11470 [Cellvibrionaceae bacterium]
MFSEVGFFTKIRHFWEAIQFILEHRKQGKGMIYHAERYNSPGKYDADYFLVNDHGLNSVRFFYEDDVELNSSEGLDFLKTATMPLPFKQFGAFDGYLPDVFATFEDYLFISDTVKQDVEALNIKGLSFYPAKFNCKDDVCLEGYYICIFKYKPPYYNTDTVQYGRLDESESDSSEVLERFSLNENALNKVDEKQRLLFQLDLENTVLCHRSVAAIFDQQFYPIEPLSLKWLD